MGSNQSIQSTNPPKDRMYTKEDVFQLIDMLKEKLAEIPVQLDRIKDQIESYERRNPDMKDHDYKDIYFKIGPLHDKTHEISQALRFGIK